MRAARLLARSSAAAGSVLLGAVTFNCHAPQPQTGDTNRQGSVFAFGSGFMGATGLGIETDVAVPSVISALGTSVSSVAASSSSASSAAVAEGEVYLWGQNILHGGSMPQDTPTPLPGLPPSALPVAVAVGEVQGHVLTADGEVYGFGRRASGTGTAKQVSVPTKLRLGDAPVVALAAGREHSLALDAEGCVWAWGAGSSYATGFGSKEDVLAPKKVASLCPGSPLLGGSRVVAVAAGRDHSLFLTSDGRVFACGADDNGQCASGDTSRYVRQPQQVVGVPHGCSIVAIAAGAAHSVALSSSGAVFTWGSGQSGQLGHADRSDIAVARKLQAVLEGRVVSIAAGGSHSLLLTDTAQVYAFGKGRNGQLGRGDELESVAAYRTEPLRVPGLSGKRVLQVAAGRDHTLALLGASAAASVKK